MDEPTRPPGAEPPAPAELSEVDEEPVALPRWIPIVIGIALLGMAGLAVYTGIHYRSRSLGKRIVSRVSTAVRGNEAGPPGEPVPGASHVVHGSSGENAPAPWSPGFPNTSRISITGGQGSVLSSIRLAATRGVQLKVTPPDAVVYVNDKPIGEARQFSSEDEVWEFPADAEDGNFHFRFDAEGYRDQEYIVMADPNSTNEVAVIELKLQKK